MFSSTKKANTLSPQQNLRVREGLNTQEAVNPNPPFRLLIYI